MKLLMSFWKDKRVSQLIFIENIQLIHHQKKEFRVKRTEKASDYFWYELLNRAKVYIFYFYFVFHLLL